MHAAIALREMGYETVMVNCNPETVSTDYSTSDRLYFEPLTAEDLAEVIAAESAACTEGASVRGVIVSLGGQTPLKLLTPLIRHWYSVHRYRRSTTPKIANGGPPFAPSSACGNHPVPRRFRSRKRVPSRSAWGIRCSFVRVTS